MNKDYSLDALNRFIDYTISKGILKPETAKSRKVASNKILEQITSEERADLRQVDLDTEAERFANRQGSGYHPASLQVYKSRARSALLDFFAYVDNPMTFKPSTVSRTSGRSSSTGPRRSSSPSKPAAPVVDLASAAVVPSNDLAHHSLVFPIPIRPGLVVKVSNIPDDLTAQEAEKIALVVKALAYKD